MRATGCGPAYFMADEGMGDPQEPPRAKWRAWQVSMGIMLLCEAVFHRHHGTAACLWNGAEEIADAFAHPPLGDYLDGWNP